MMHNARLFDPDGPEVMKAAAELLERQASDLREQAAHSYSAGGSDPFEGIGTDPMKDRQGRTAEARTDQPKRKGSGGGKTVDRNPESMKLFRAAGYVCEKTQWYEAHLVWNRDTKQREVMGGHRKDLFGMFDAQAFGVGRGVIGVQTCAYGPSVSTHIREACKIESKDGRNMLMAWFLAANRFIVVAWTQTNEAGEPSRFWRAVYYEVTLATVQTVLDGRRLDLKQMEKDSKQCLKS